MTVSFSVFVDVGQFTFNDLRKIKLQQFVDYILPKYLLFCKVRVYPNYFTFVRTVEIR